jgi:hypothetical protein
MLSGVDQEFIAAVFEEELTTPPARGQGLAVARDDTERPQAPTSLTEEITEE